MSKRSQSGNIVFDGRFSRSITHFYRVGKANSQTAEEDKLLRDRQCQVHRRFNGATDTDTHPRTTMFVGG